MIRKQTVAWTVGLGVAAAAALGAAPAAGQVGGGDPSGGPTAAQERYLDGLRLSGRGVAQLKSGIDQVMRWRSDSAQLRTAGLRLGGLCGSARSFLRQGRTRMAHTAYGDSVRLIARRLNTEIDTLVAYLPTCQREAGRAPEQTAASIVSRLRGYEAALQRFRAAAILPIARQQDSGSQKPR